jgi:hypothetical protein
VTRHASPPWRQLSLLGALVVLAHVLVLQISPMRMGAKFDREPKPVRTFSTRSIEAPPVPVPVVPAPVPVPVKAPRKLASHKAPHPQEIQPQPPLNTAIDTPDPAAEPLPDTTTELSTTADATPAATISASQAPATTSTSIVATTLPAGPATTPVTAVTLPPSVLLQYRMIGASKGLTYHANAELSWVNAGGQYDASMKVSAFLIGARSMTSAGQITATGLAPTRFADKFRSELAAHFLPDQGKITFSANTPDAPWIEGAQDRVSVFLQLGGMLAAKPQDFPAGSEITLYTIGPREADTWTFVVETQDQLQIMGHEMTTVKVTRKPRREFDQKVEIWFAPSMGYLPVRNRITQQNGDFIDQELSDISKP